MVPDQLKSGVARSCWYDPKIQRTYEAMAEHYGTTVMPARPGKPRDKAKVGPTLGNPGSLSPGDFHVLFL